jgi:hypothetical protein
VTGNRGGGLVRSVLDISADADEYTGFAVGFLTFGPGGTPTYTRAAVGGTSEAAPLVTGMVVAAQQGQRSSFGFLNTVLYRLAGTSALHDTRPLTARSPVAYRATVCDAADCIFEALTVMDDQRGPWRLYRAGHAQGLRQHGRRRHPGRPAIHHRIARAGDLGTASAPRVRAP